MAIERLFCSDSIPDDLLTGNGDSQEILVDILRVTVDSLAGQAASSGKEPDWRTLDLRIHRGIKEAGDRLERDPHLTVRALVLTKEEVE